MLCVSVAEVPLCHIDLSKKDLVNCKNGAYLASSVIRTDGIIMGELLPL